MQKNNNKIIAKKIKGIAPHALPVVFMIGLIPIVQDDYILAGIYILITIVFFLINTEKYDTEIFLFGFVALAISEFFFISTGVEIFLRNSLFGIMPVWLPFLWGYAFVAIKRSIKILEGQD